jgi:hypothetical protein
MNFVVFVYRVMVWNRLFSMTKELNVTFHLK